MSNHHCVKFCNRTGLGKIVYLTCATLFTASFIIQFILLHLVILPYLSETEFLQTVCTYNRSVGGQFRPCENKCSKENSEFPCLEIIVTYRDNENQTRNSVLYDTYDTYALDYGYKCSTSTCLTRKDDNKAYVLHFNDSLSLKGTFPCYYNSKSKTDVLLHKSQTFTTMIHCIVWPAGIFTLSVITLFLTWAFAGCSVWTHDKTVLA